ncbi:RNA polymerase sigma factor [Streptomyces sp. NPDC058122]|uniref:RNA polymerase sigma factor n=1 Tax=Streptomyces sp. NPDC058122 TaxID=3346349 RepID=UPI0036EEAED1
MNVEITIGLGGEQLQYAAQEYLQALREGDRKATTTAQLLRRTLGALSRRSGPSPDLLHEVLEDPEAYGPPAIRDVLLHWAQQAGTYGRDQSALSPTGQFVRFFNELIVRELIEGSSIGSPTARMLRRRSDATTAASAVRRSRDAVGAGGAADGSQRGGPADLALSAMPSRDGPSDAELLATLQESQSRTEWNQAFSVLAERYMPRVHTCCRQNGFDHHTAEELTQQTMLDVFVTLSEHTVPKDPSRFSQWIMALARSRMGRESRRQWWEGAARSLKASDLDLVPAQAGESEDTFLRPLWAMIDTVAASLGERQRHLFQLYMEGTHAEQIARQLNISVQAVRNRCHDVRTQVTEGLYAYLLLNEGEHDCRQLRAINVAQQAFTAEVRTGTLRHMRQCPTCRENAHHAVWEWTPQ